MSSEAGMSKERLLKILLSPHTSEKAYRISDAHRQVTFKVALNATKREIKHAVEKLFEVIVEAVRVVVVKGKKRRTGRIVGKTKKWKKAYVSLAPGHDINFGDTE